MLQKLKRVLDRTFWIYVGLGITNYLVCNTVMLVLYNLCGFGKDSAFGVYYCLQTLISLLLNRFVTFRRLPVSRLWPLRFLLSIGLSYVLAKVLLKKLAEWFVAQQAVAALLEQAAGDFAPRLAGNLVLVACSLSYCAINYVGQRYFVFRRRTADSACADAE